MTETIDFLTYVANMDKSSQPLDMETIMKTLDRISDEVIWGYVDVCSQIALESGLFRDILSCLYNRPRCERLISSLNEEQLANFSKVVNYLKDAEELNDFKRLVNATMNLETPTEASMEKAAQLFNTMKEKNEADLKTIAGNLFRLCKHLHILAGFYYNFKLGNSDEHWIDALAQLSEKDLNDLIPLSKKLIKVKNEIDHVL